MSVIAHGIDVVYVPRLRHMFETHGQRMLDRLYTPAEQQYCREAKDAVIRLAGRFAVKEAVMKMLGTGWRGGVEWTHIETLPDPLGRPLVALTGTTALLAERLGVARVLVSISHSGDYATASVLGLAAE